MIPGVLPGADQIRYFRVHRRAAGNKCRLVADIRSSLLQMPLIDTGAVFRYHHGKRTFVHFGGFIEFFERVHDLSPRLNNIPRHILAWTLVRLLIALQANELIMSYRFSEPETRKYIHTTVEIYLNGLLEKREEQYGPGNDPELRTNQR